MESSYTLTDGMTGEERHVYEVEATINVGDMDPWTVSKLVWHADDEGAEKFYAPTVDLLAHRLRGTVTSFSVKRADDAAAREFWLDTLHHRAYFERHESQPA